MSYTPRNPDPPTVSWLRRRQTDFCCFGLLNCAVLNGFVVDYLLAAAGSTHHLEVWPSPTGRRRWWNKACSLPVLMLFVVFVLFFCPFYSAAAKRSRRVALRACASRCSLHPPPPPLCPAPPTLPAVTSSGLSFLGKLNRAATAALASPGLISHKIMSWISSHSHPTVVHSLQIVPFSSLFHFEQNVAGLAASPLENITDLKLSPPDWDCFIIEWDFVVLDKRWFLVPSLHFFLGLIHTIWYIVQFKINAGQPKYK